jgi:hypothetical protein
VLAKTELPLAWILGRSCVVQHPAQLFFFFRGQRASARRLRLEQRAQEHPVINLRAYRAKIPAVGLAADLLGLKDLRLAFTTTLAQHDAPHQCAMAARALATSAVSLSSDCSAFASFAVFTAKMIACDVRGLIRRRDLNPA